MIFQPHWRNHAMVCVLAPDEGRTGIYLDEAAKSNSHLAAVLLPSAPLEQSPYAPERAIKIVKPFWCKVLAGPTQLAEAWAAES